MQHGPLQTTRLRLIPVTGADPQTIADAVGDLEVARWLTRVPHPYALEDAAAFQARVAEGGWPIWAIQDADGLAGVIGIESELGYWLARRAWGRGYATETGEAVLDWYFRSPEAEPVGSSYFVANDRSRNVLQKLGFSPISGPTPVIPLSTGETVMVQGMVLTPEQWHTTRPWAVETARLILRPLTPRDAPRLAEIGGIPEIARNLFVVTSPWPVAAARRWIETGRWRGRLGFRFGIWTKEDGLIGAAAIGNDTLHTAYFLDPAYWGRGLTTEAMAGLIEATFSRFPKLTALHAEHFDDNPASRALLCKLGFTETGRGHAHSAGRLEPAAIILYRLDRPSLRAHR